METGYAGARQPTFVMRYTAGDLAQIPDALRAKIASGTVQPGSGGRLCRWRRSRRLRAYSIAVLLYP